MQLNLNIPLTQIDGTPIPGKTVGQFLAESIVSQAKGDVIKLYGWGIKLAANEPLELDESDRQMLKDVVTNSEAMTILLKGPVIQAIAKLSS